MNFSFSFIKRLLSTFHTILMRSKIHRSWILRTLIHIIIPCLLLAISFGLFSNLTMVQSMIERNIRWNTGSAPIHQLALGDIESKSWMAQCWEQLDNFTFLTLFAHSLVSHGTDMHPRQ